MLRSWLMMEAAELCFTIVFGMYRASQSAQMCSRVVGDPPQKMQYFEALAMQGRLADPRRNQPAPAARGMPRASPLTPDPSKSGTRKKSLRHSFA